MRWPSFEAALVQSGVIIEPPAHRPVTLSEALELMRALDARYRARRSQWKPAFALDPEDD